MRFVQFRVKAPVRLVRAGLQPLGVRRDERVLVQQVRLERQQLVQLLTHQHRMDGQVTVAARVRGVEVLGDEGRQVRVVRHIQRLQEMSQSIHPQVDGQQPVVRVRGETLHRVRILRILKRPLEQGVPADDARVKLRWQVGDLARYLALLVEVEIQRLFQVPQRLLGFGGIAEQCLPVANLLSAFRDTMPLDPGLQQGVHFGKLAQVLLMEAVEVVVVFRARHEFLEHLRPVIGEGKAFEKARIHRAGHGSRHQTPQQCQPDARLHSRPLPVLSVMHYLCPIASRSSLVM